MIRRFLASPASARALIGVALVPLLYAGTLIYAFWNPYDASVNVPAAIVNQDQPASINGDDTTIGDSVVDQLLADPQLTWTVTDAATAQQGLDSGRFYAVLTIPEDFSARLASQVTNKPEQAQLVVTTNDATNYLVSVLAKDALMAAQGTASQGIQAQVLDVVYKDAGKAVAQARKAAEGAAQIAQGNAEIADVVQGAVTDLDGVPALVQDIDDDIQAAAGRIEQVPDAVKSLDGRLAKLEQDLAAKGEAELAAQVGQVRSALEDDVLPLADQAASAAKDAAAFANDATSVVEKAAKQADGAVAQVDELAAGSQELADGLAKALTGLPDVLEASETDFADVLSQPVVVNGKTQNTVATFGDGFAPYFVPLGLFVGAITGMLLLRSLDTRALLLASSPWRMAASSWLDIVILGTVQSVILLAILVWVIGVQAASLVGLALIMWVSSIAFLSLVWLLKAAMGVVGNATAIVLLVIQLAGSGGAYPIQTFPEVFQVLKPFLPMSYSVDGVRRTIAGGPLSPYVTTDLVVLAGMTAVLLGLGIWVAARKQRFAVADLEPEPTLA